MLEKLIFLVISSAIGWLLGMALGWVCVRFRSWTHRCFSTPKNISIHEAGHLLVYLKYCPWWNDRYAFNKFASNIDYLNMHEDKQCGCMHINQQKFGWGTPVNRELHKRLYLGGMAAVLKLSNKKASRWNIFVQDHVFGCCSDLDYMKLLGFSRKECVPILKEIMTNFDADDIEFIKNAAEILRCSGKDADGFKIMRNGKIRKLAYDYRELYN